MIALINDIHANIEALCAVIEDIRRHNSGSVGQPRDRDNRACYLLFDEKNREVTWRRVAYDIDSVVKKSDKMCGKDNWCGARLRQGK
jgi:diadenosine tetraphosphatase ApaH/serine/threonine PP2A family protein phosphatase